MSAAFNGGAITSNAGALLLWEIDRFVGLFDRVAACFTDHRDPRLTEHSVRTLVAQRSTGIALGVTTTSTTTTICGTTRYWSCWRAGSRDAGRLRSAGGQEDAEPRTRGSSRKSAGNWPTPRQEAARHGRPARRFAEFPYATLTSWSRRRRVVAKAEHLRGKANPRFVVTSLPAATFSARTVYERVYCPRGDMENTIKEQQLDLFSDRTSASRFAANQLRLKLLKIGVRITVSVRRVRVAMDSAHPSAAAFARVHARLRG